MGRSLRIGGFAGARLYANARHPVNETNQKAAKKVAVLRTRHRPNWWNARKVSRFEPTAIQFRKTQEPFDLGPNAFASNPSRQQAL
jgi:hypothetical protein